MAVKSAGSKLAAIKKEAAKRAKRLKAERAAQQSEADRREWAADARAARGES